MSVLLVGNMPDCEAFDRARQRGLRCRLRAVAPPPTLDDERSDRDEHQGDHKQADPAALPSLARLPVHKESLQQGNAPPPHTLLRVENR
jgi:hypothetical protein